MSVYLDYARKGRNAWWRYLLSTPLSLLLFAMAFGVVVTALMVARRLPPDLASELTRPAHPVLFFTWTGVAFGCLAIGFAGGVRLAHGKSPLDLLGRWRWSDAALGASVWLLVLLVGLGLDALASPGSIRITASAATGPAALAAAGGLAVQTFAEEYVFRGYATQGLLLATRRPWAAALISGLIFGALHAPNGGPQALNAVAFGVVASILAIRSGGLGLTFGLHFVNNLFGAVVLVSENDVFRGVPGLLTQSGPQLIGLDLAVSTAALLTIVWFTRGMSRRS